MIKFYIYLVCFGFIYNINAMEKPQTYFLELLPTEVRYELANYRFENLIKDMLHATDKKDLTSLVDQFKEILLMRRDRGKRLLEQERLKGLLKPLLINLALNLDKGEFASLLKLQGFLRAKVELWKIMECELIAACLEGNLVKVKFLMEDEQVDPNLPFLISTEDQDCALKLNISTPIVPAYNYAIEKGHNAIADYILENSTPLVFNPAPSK